MGAKTGIEWTDATWNPILGCSRVSEGCRNCYAETIAGRFGQGKPTVYSGLTQIVNGRSVWTGVIKETRQLLQPLSWRSPRRVFVNSMSDLFHENVSDELRDRIFAVMALCPQHAFQVLTKRPERMLAYLSDSDTPLRVLRGKAQVWQADRHEESLGLPRMTTDYMLPNVWLGVSVENQRAADERIPLLLQTPAAVRFISAEPLLGLIDLEALPSASGIGRHLNALSNAGVDAGAEIPTKLDWVIVGGESGPHARPMHLEWARSLRDQCRAAGVDFFFKQWGEWVPAISLDEPLDGQQERFMKVGKHAAGAILDGREWRECPNTGLAGAIFGNYT
jgi:protein gp37